MKVDRKRFKELQKEAGGILKQECVFSLRVNDYLGVEGSQVGVFTLYPNGIYMKFGLSVRDYIPINSLEKIEFDNGVINIYAKDECTLKLATGNKGLSVLVYNLLGKHLGMEFDSLNLEGSEEVLKNLEKDEERKKRSEEFDRTREEYKRSKREAAEKKKNEEKLQRAAEMERLRNAGRTVPPSEQRSYKSDNDSNVASCPKCRSTSITANRKGFSAVKGVLGLTVSPLAGAIAGGAGRNKVMCTCLKCGYQWKAGKK